MVVVVDSPDRENEGDLCMAAEYVTADAINFMATHGRGLICLTLTPERCEELGPAADGPAQPDAVRDRLHRLDRGPRGHRDGHLGQGPRAHDRGRLRDRPRARATSSSPATCSRCARARAACSSAPARPRPPSTSRGSPGVRPAGVICEVMKADGTMARVPDLVDVLRRARAQALLGRRPDRVPPPHRAARRAPGRPCACRRRGASSRRSATAS